MRTSWAAGHLVLAHLSNQALGGIDVSGNREAAALADLLDELDQGELGAPLGIGELFQLQVLGRSEGLKLLEAIGIEEAKQMTGTRRDLDAWQDGELGARCGSEGLLDEADAVVVSYRNDINFVLDRR